VNEKNAVAMQQAPAIPAVKKTSILAKMGERFSVDPTKLHETLAATVFKGATQEQTVALLIVADQYGLNPFTKEIYAFPAKGGGIVPVVGIDGWLRIINENPAFNGMETKYDSDEESCTCKIYRKDRSHPIEATEYLEECRRNTDPWNTCPKRMLRHKAIIQCARIAFGFSGFHDEDEAHIIADSEAQVVDTRPLGKPAVKDPTSKKAKSMEILPTAPSFADQLYIRAEELGKTREEVDEIVSGFGAVDLNNLPAEHFEQIISILERVPE